MKDFKFKSGNKCYLVLENEMHHGLYFDLLHCFHHYTWLLNMREPGSSFQVYELLYDSDLGSFVPNGFFCHILSDKHIIFKYKTDLLKVQSLTDYFNLSLEDSDLRNHCHKIIFTYE